MPASFVTSVVCELMLFTRAFTDASKATRRAMTIMADAVPFFRNSILNAIGCIGFAFELTLGCGGGYVKPDLAPTFMILVLVDGLVIYPEFEEDSLVIANFCKS